MSDEAPRKSLQQLIEEGVAARHHPNIPPLERAAGKLRQVVRWHGEMPATGYHNANGTDASFGAAFGANGERDFMRALVSSALLDLDEVKHGATEALKELLAAWEADDLPRWRTALIAARKVAPK